MSAEESNSQDTNELGNYKKKLKSKNSKKNVKKKRRNNS